MLKIENLEAFNFEGAFRGLRNPMNSWNKSDSHYGYESEKYHKDMYIIGPNDMALAQRMTKAGSDERKYLRQIFVSMDITAPMYFYKQSDTYKVNTVRNSTSTMHKITSKEFTLDDFSYENLTQEDNEFCGVAGIDVLLETIANLNEFREAYLKTKDKKYWWQLIQLLPSSYNQKSTYTCNYENLLNMYHARKNHKLDEWHQFCEEIEKLPYFYELCIQPFEKKEETK